MKKIFFIAITLLFTSHIFYANNIYTNDTLSSSKRRTDINFYVGGELTTDKRTQQEALSQFQISYALLNFQGNYNKNLSYRFRFRLNRPFSPTSMDNASVGMDFAFLSYYFGNKNQWEARIGKQYAMVGSFELDINPLYDYIYSDYINYIINPFPVAFLLNYQLSENQKIGIQALNTRNETLAPHLGNSGFTTRNMTSSKTPISAYLYWMGNFFDGTFLTNYSYNVSQLTQGDFLQMLSFGNQLHIGKHSAYLDLMYTYMNSDDALVASKALNLSQGRLLGDYLMQRDVAYASAISRYQYQLDEHWSLAGKLGIEFSGQGNTFRENLRTNYLYFLAGQYEPFKTQDFRFYIAYVGNTIDYARSLELPIEQLHRVTIGACYTLPVLKLHH